MRWLPVSNNVNNEVYDLWHEDKKLLTLKLHPFSNTGRVECNDEKRVFQIRKEGFLRNKVVLRNEYGVKLGELGTADKENFIDINDERFYYRIQNNPLAELVLYKESPAKPFVTCSLEAADGNTKIQFTNNKALPSHSSLLLALCWYMFLSIAKENVVVYAIN